MAATNHGTVFNAEDSKLNLSLELDHELAVRLIEVVKKVSVERDMLINKAAATGATGTGQQTNEQICAEKKVNGYRTLNGAVVAAESTVTSGFDSRHRFCDLF